MSSGEVIIIRLLTRGIFLILYSLTNISFMIDMRETTTKNNMESWTKFCEEIAEDVQKIKDQQ